MDYYLNDDEQKEHEAQAHGVGYCYDCMYWTEIEPPTLPPPHHIIYHEGTCRRYPPTAPAIPGDDLVQLSWPWTDCDDWCGEFAESSR